MKKKIAVLYPAFMGGGAESVCVWMLKALKEEYDLTLFTFTFRDFQELNNLYGTDLSEEEIRVVCPVPKVLVGPLKFIFNNLNPFRAFRQYKMSEFFKNFSEDFDLAISAYNEMDMGKPGIQYIFWIGVVKDKKRYFQKEKIKINLTLTCSKTVAGFIKRDYGIDAQVIYPPVSSCFPIVPQEDKEEGFVCIGRIVKEKSPHRGISILKKVRDKGFPVHLHIIGSSGNIRYMRFLRKLQRENASWVFLDKGKNHKDFCSLVAQHKYGIHWKREPFGIAVAEMLRAGCIPFVKNGGGQTEIVGDNENLLFGSDDEAVDKICALFADKDKQAQILDYLSERENLFSEKKFMDEIKETVDNFLAFRQEDKLQV